MDANYYASDEAKESGVGFIVQFGSFIPDILMFKYTATVVVPFQGRLAVCVWRVKPKLLVDIVNKLKNPDYG